MASMKLAALPLEGRRGRGAGEAEVEGSDRRGGLCLAEYCPSAWLRSSSWADRYIGNYDGNKWLYNFFARSLSQKRTRMRASVSLRHACVRMRLSVCHAYVRIRHSVTSAESLFVFVRMCRVFFSVRFFARYVLLFTHTHTHTHTHKCMFLILFRIQFSWSGLSLSSLFSR